MVIKKYTLLLAAFLVFQAAAFAQSTDWGWDWKDSSKVPVKSMPQYNEFLQNKYPYPPKPRNAWEFGVAAGYAAITGDVKSRPGFGGALTLRKAINHTFSVRLGYFGAFQYGKPNNALASQQREYKNWSHTGAVDMIVSLNTISFNRGNPKTNVYLLGGYNLVATRVMIKNNTTGNYNVFYGQGLSNTKDNIIGTFGGATVNNRNAWTLVHGFSYGGGIAFKVSPKLNIGLEQRFTAMATGYDYLDGVADDSKGDVFSFTSLRFNFNLGN
ncbi:MAG: hypothetical protein ACOVNY_13575 [Chitinophagaceae bacterium]